MIRFSISKDRKVFFKLMIALILLVSLFTVTLIIIMKNSNLIGYKVFIKIMILTLITIIIYLFLIVYLILKIFNNKYVPKNLVNFVEKSIKLIYPIIILLANTLNIEKDSIRRVFSQINNNIVILKSPKLNNNEILVIAPHCLQKSFCKHKITGNIENCHKCGACDIQSLIEVCNKYGVKLEIVTGGTLARKIIKEYKPKGIVAIACERDLSSGILDTKLIPVIGVTNERPEGPCKNTCVNTSNVEKAIKLFMGRLT